MANNIHTRSSFTRDMDLTEYVDCFSTDGDMNHMNVTQRNSSYYEVDDVNMLSVDKKFQLKVMHLNIQILPSKFDHLKLLLHRLDNCGLYFDFILLCETFLNNINYGQPQYK